MRLGLVPLPVQPPLVCPGWFGDGPGLVVRWLALRHQCRGLALGPLEFCDRQLFLLALWSRGNLTPRS